MFLLKRLQVILLFLLAVFGFSSSFANNATLTISGINILHHQRTSGTRGSLNYQFRVTNNLGTALPLEVYTVGKKIPGFIPDTAATTCPAIGQSLAAYGQCILAYTAPIPVIGADESKSLLDTLTIKDGAGYKTTSPEYGITLLPLSTMGHFLLSSTTDPKVTELDLSSGDEDHLTLQNIGKGTITNLTFAFSETVGSTAGTSLAFANYFSGTCLSTHSLAAGSRCTLTYKLPANPNAGAYRIRITGSNANESPYDVAVYIAVEGHFVFRNADGTHNIDTLNLHPDSQGIIRLYNTGVGDITGVSLNFSTIDHRDISDDTCTGILKKDHFCSFRYHITHTVSGNYTIKANGSGVDNSPELKVNITAQGHFVFLDSNTDPIETPISAIIGSYEEMTLKNTGNGTIDNINFDFAGRANYFSGNCLDTRTLASEASCELSYYIPPDAVAGPFNITVTGDGATPGSAALTFKVRHYGIAAGIIGSVSKSSDGITWTNSRVGYSAFSHITHAIGKYVMVATTNSIYHSILGENWIKSTCGTSSRTLNGLTFAKGRFVTVGQLDTICTSPDGNIWTERNVDGFADMLNAVAYGEPNDDPTYVAVGNYSSLSSRDTIVTSTNGVQWKTLRSQSIAQANLYGVAYGTDHGFVAVGDDGKIIQSDTGAKDTWTLKTSFTTATLRDVIFANNQFVAVGAGGTILTSPDGTSWTVRTSGISQTLSGIAYDPIDNQYVAVGTKDATGYAVVLVSTDNGVTWNLKNSSSLYDLRSITF